MNKQEDILEKAKAQIIQLYKNRLNEHTPYHTLEHTDNVVATADKIGSKVSLEEDERMEISLAVYFLYVGYWQETDLTEELAVSNLNAFIDAHGLDINAPKIAQLMASVEDATEDKSLSEAVLYDAHFSYLGKKKLTSRLEVKALEENPEEDVLNEFRRTYEFLTSHKFRTNYAIRKYEARKAKNGQKLLATIRKEEAKDKKAKRKSRKLGRGIETMYRTVYRNHINLSSIADAKANLIIRVNTIILSIIITLGGTGYTFFESGFFKYSRFTIPIMIFVAGSLAAVIFAILSARPKVTNKDVTKKRLLGKESSILFFGNFRVMEKKDFVREMGLFRKNDDRVYDSMSVDIYYLGLVLDKKYKLVTYSYNVFMAGLTLSVVSFMALFMLTQFSA